MALVVAALMPWLAKEKRRLSAATSSAALRADAAQSALVTAAPRLLWSLVVIVCSFRRYTGRTSEFENFSSTESFVCRGCGKPLLNH